MRFLTTPLALAALALTAATAHAELAVSIDQRIEIRANPAALAAAKVVMEKRNVDAVFAMSSGRSMQIQSDGDALSVRYGRSYTSTLRHDGQGTFVSQDRKMMMQFSLDDQGDLQTASLVVPSTLR